MRISSCHETRARRLQIRYRSKECAVTYRRRRSRFFVRQRCNGVRHAVISRRANSTWAAAIATTT